NWAVPYRLPALSRTNLPAGIAPSFPPVNLCSTVSLPVVSSLKTTPRPLPPPHAKLPPELVVPYRLPTMSRTNPAAGPAPSAHPVKLWSTVTLPVVLSLKMTPHPLGHFPWPPVKVVPYRLPALSRTNPAAVEGAAPSAPPVKLCSTVSLPVVSSLKTTPHPLPPPPAPSPLPSPQAKVVPFRFSARPRPNPVAGSAPSVLPVNLCSAVSLPVISSLNTTPPPLPPSPHAKLPPAPVVPYRLPAAS